MKNKKNLYLILTAASVMALSCAGAAFAESVAEEETEAASYFSAEPSELIIQNASDYVELCNFEDLELISYYSTATEDDLEQQMEYIRYEFSESEEITDGAEEGDQIKLTMTYTVDGESETDEDVLYELGYPEFGEEFDAALEGAKPGDVLNLDVTYSDEDYIYEDWLEKTVSFELQITAVTRTHVPELNEEFVKDTLGYESMEEFEEVVMEMLQNSLDTQNAQTSYAQAVDTAVENSTFIDYPEEEVTLALNSIHAQYEYLAELLGTDVDTLYEEYEIDEADLEEQARENAGHRVLVSAVIQQENIPFTEETMYEVAESLYEYYEYSSPEELLAYFGDDIVYLAAEQLVGQYLLDKAHVTREEDVDYLEDFEYDETEDGYYADGDADAWYEDEDESEDDEEYWSDEEFSEEEDDSYWYEEDTDAEEE